MSFYPENEALTVRLWENKRAYECGGVAELADAADLKSASSECGFESHRPYQFAFTEEPAAVGLEPMRWEAVKQTRQWRVCRPTV